MLVGPAPRFVSRAGHKLEGALDRFGIDPSGWRVLDAGASTGGFTDCLLQHGAAEVVAVDVGHNQLHEKLEGDERVRNVERTNLRTLDPAIVGEPVDAVVADLSFISLRLVLAPVLAVCRPGAQLVLLVKPQFEAGRAEAAKGQGIVRDPQVWRRVLHEVIAALVSQRAAIMGVMPSPITGTDGNVEFVVHALAPGAPPAALTAAGDEPTVSTWVDGAVAEAASREERA